MVRSSQSIGIGGFLGIIGISLLFLFFLATLILSTSHTRRRPTYLEYVRAHPHARMDDPFIADHHDRIFAGDPTAIQEFNDHILYLQNKNGE
jgi:hypothetical protein